MIANGGVIHGPHRLPMRELGTFAQLRLHFEPHTPYALDICSVRVDWARNRLSLHKITCDISIRSDSKHVSTALLA